MAEEKKKSIFDKIWDVFASVKLAVVIFALIAATSVVGTIIEQQADPEKNVKVLVKMFGFDHDAAHSVLGVLDSLGFTNMYHSWWFPGFLPTFAANLIICSIDRLPHIWKLVQEKIRPVPASYLEKMSIKHAVTVQGKTSGIRDTVAAALKSAGFRPAEAAEGPSVQLYAEKGNYTRLGVYITHLSILIILAGAIIGFFLAVLLAFMTPLLYKIQVGRQYFVPVPPSVVILFELTMLGMLLATFLGVFLDSFFPNYRAMEYVKEVSDGKIAVFIVCPAANQDKITKAMSALGAEQVRIAEAQHL